MDVPRQLLGARKSISVYLYRSQVTPLIKPAPNQSSTVVEYNELSSTTETNPVLCQREHLCFTSTYVPGSPKRERKPTKNQKKEDFRSGPGFACVSLDLQTDSADKALTGQVLARSSPARPAKLCFWNDGKKEIACRIISVCRRYRPSLVAVDFDHPVVVVVTFWSFAPSHRPISAPAVP